MCALWLWPFLCTSSGIDIFVSSQYYWTRIIRGINKKFSADVLIPNNLKWKPSQLTVLSYSTSLVERKKNQSYWFSKAANMGMVCCTEKMGIVDSRCTALARYNAPARTSQAAMAAATNCSFEVLPHHLLLLPPLLPLLLLPLLLHLLPIKGPSSDNRILSNCVFMYTPIFSWFSTFGLLSVSESEN